MHAAAVDVTCRSHLLVCVEAADEALERLETLEEARLGGTPGRWP